MALTVYIYIIYIFHSKNAKLSFAGNTLYQVWFETGERGGLRFGSRLWHHADHGPGPQRFGGCSGVKKLIQGWGPSMPQLQHWGSMPQLFVWGQQLSKLYTGWWFGTFFIFHFIYGIILPID